MSNEQLRGLRREIGTKRPLPVDVRERAMAYARRRRAEGASQQIIAGELGVSQYTVSRWVRDVDTKAGALVPVEIIDAAIDADRTGGVVVTTPRGLRVEGLDIDALCIMLARIG